MEPEIIEIRRLKHIAATQPDLLRYEDFGEKIFTTVKNKSLELYIRVSDKYRNRRSI